MDIKQTLKPILVVLIITILAGCGQTKSKDYEIKKPFPKIMVGVWESDQFDWVFRFEKDGSINKLRHMLAGDSVIKDGGIYMEGKDEGTYALFVYGECSTQYDPCLDEINVKISLDKQEMQLPYGKLEGRSEDYFTGKVSEDGKTWIVRWRSYGWLLGAEEPDPKLIEEKPIILTFTKVDFSRDEKI